MTAEDPTARATTSRRSDPDPAQVDDELRATVQNLWEQVEQLRQNNGCPNRKQISRATGLPHTTFCDWLKKRTVVPDWDDFSRIIDFLGDDAQDWRPRWNSARTAADMLRSRNTARALRHPMRVTRPTQPPRAHDPSPDGDPRFASPPDDRRHDSSLTNPADVGHSASPPSAPSQPARERRDQSKTPGQASGTPQETSLTPPARSTDDQPQPPSATPTMDPAGSGEDDPSPSTTAFRFAAKSIPPRRRPGPVVAGVLTLVVILSGVAYWVSGSPDATVPSLVGKHPRQACAALRTAGLRCAPNDNEITREVNVVHKQNHPPGTVLPKDTAVHYTYESTAPLPLRRYQAPPPDSANFISPTDPGPPGWTAQPSPGLVYAAGEEGVPGIIPIYRYRCTSGCAEKLVYFLSTDKRPKKKNWAFEDEAFRCFSPHAAPPETQGLRRLMNAKHARVWVVRGTVEHQTAVSNGFKDPDPSRGPLCHIW